MTVAVAVLAHQGGWDEILLVLGPILIIAGLLALARKRVGAAPGNQEKRSMSAPTDTSRPTRSS